MQSGLIYNKNTNTNSLGIVNPSVSQGVMENQKQISNNQQKIIQGAVNTADKIIQEKSRVADATFKLELNNTANDLMRNMYELSPDNPALFETEAKKQIEKLVSQIPGEENKVLAMGVFQNVKDNYYNKALITSNNNQDIDLKYQSMKFLDSQQGYTEDYFKNKFNGLTTQKDDLVFNNIKNNIEEQQNQKGVNGQYLFNNKEKINNYNRIIKQSKINGGIGYFNELFENIETDYDSFINTVDTWEKQPNETQKKYDLDQTEYQSIMKNARAYKTAIEKELKNNTRENLRAGKLKEDADKILIQEQTKFELESLIDGLNIKTEKGIETITNKQYDNIETLADIWHKVEQQQVRGNLDIKDRNKILSKIRPAYLRLLENKDLKEKTNIKGEKFWFRKDQYSVSEYTLKKLNTFAVNKNGKEDFNVLNPDEKLFLINGIFAKIKEKKNISLDSAFTENDVENETKKFVDKTINDFLVDFNTEKFGGLKKVKFDAMSGKIDLNKTRYNKEKEKQLNNFGFTNWVK